jgi:hypothetical protein
LPQNAEALLDARISSLEDRSGRFVAEISPEFRALLTDAERLARVDAANASTLKARIFALAGDRARVDYWFGNARKLTPSWRIDFNHGYALANLGFFSEAASLCDQSLQVETGMLPKCVEVAVFTLNLSGALTAYEALERAGLESARHYRDFAHTAARILRDVGITQAQAQAALDVAGGLLREQQLLWLRDAPRLFAHRSAGDRGILIEFQLAVGPTEASSLSAELIDRLVAADLDLPCVSISFIGLGPNPSTASTPATPLKGVL